MRSSHPRRASTWPTTWFSTFWRQPVSMAATATSAAFDSRALRAHRAAFESPMSRNPHSRFPRHYYYNLNHGRKNRQYRNRTQGRGTDGGHPDKWRTCCNSEDRRPDRRWSKSGGRMSSNHRPQWRVVPFFQVGVRVRKRANFECAFSFTPPDSGLFGFFVLLLDICFMSSLVVVLRSALSYFRYFRFFDN